MISPHLFILSYDSTVVRQGSNRALNKIHIKTLMIVKEGGIKIGGHFLQ